MPADSCGENWKKNWAFGPRTGLKSAGSLNSDGSRCGQEHGKDGTRQTNELLLAQIKRQFGDELLSEIDEVELQAWLNSLAKGYSGSVIRHIRHFLKNIFMEAVEQGFITRSPARGLRLPILRPVQRQYLTEQEIAKLLSVVTGRDRLLLRLILATALRPSELFALRWSCFQPDSKILLITESIYRGQLRPYTKTTNSDSHKSLLKVFVPDILVQELQEYRSGQPDAWTGVSLHLSEREGHTHSEGELPTTDFDAVGKTSGNIPSKFSDFTPHICYTFAESRESDRHRCYTQTLPP